jgi:hypothetical protein
MGSLLFLGGLLIVGFQLYLWLREGVWSPYPLSGVVEHAIRGTGGMMEVLPFVKSESVHLVANFEISDFPGYLRRFFETIPLSAFLIVTGHFCLKWSKYMGVAR